MSLLQNTPTEPDSKLLNSADRCDKCGAQAYVWVVMGNGFDLLFCNHHFIENKQQIIVTAKTVHDESSNVK